MAIRPYFGHMAFMSLERVLQMQQAGEEIELIGPSCEE
jgi:hypothetical protein